MKLILLLLILCTIKVSALRAVEQKCIKSSVYSNFQQAIKNSDGEVIVDQSNWLGPTRDQDSVGWCYAFSGADLYEHWLKRKGHLAPNRRQQNVISSVAISLNYHSKDWSKRTAKFQDLAKGRMLYLPQIEKNRRELNRLAIKRMNLSKNSIRIFDNHYKSHPRYSELNKLTAKMKNIPHGPARDRLEDTIYQLEDLIEGDVYRSGAFQNEIKQNNSAKTQLDENMKEVNRFLAIFKKETKVGEDMIPEAGFVKRSLLSMWPQICFEEEISSRDNQFHQLYSSYRELIKSVAFEPTNLQGALGYLSLLEYEYQWTGDANKCLGLELMQSIFPGAEISLLGSLSTFFKDNKNSENIFAKLLQLSCSSKGLPKPKISEKLISRELPIVKSHDLINQLETALNSGQVASVYYRSQLLDADGFDNERQDNHASLIVGKSLICGEEYYILRNSHGKGACEKRRDTFKMKETSKLKGTVAQNEKRKCIRHANLSAKNKYPLCRDNPCFEQREGHRVELLEQCLNQFRQEVLKVSEHPYFCDQRGNFIINKKYFIKGLYGVATIDN